MQVEANTKGFLFGPSDWGQWFLIARKSISFAVAAAVLYITFSYLEMVESKQKQQTSREKEPKVKRKERNKKTSERESSNLSFL